MPPRTRFLVLAKAEPCVICRVTARDGFEPWLKVELFSLFTRDMGAQLRGACVARACLSCLNTLEKSGSLVFAWSHLRLLVSLPGLL